MLLCAGLSLYVCVCTWACICACYNIQCSPSSEPTAEIVSHDVMELQFLGVGDSAFSPCRSVSQGKCIPPSPFSSPFPFLSFLCPLAALALQLFFVSIHLFIFLHSSLCLFDSPFCSFSLWFIFHNPIQSFSFRFINRSYTLLLCCLSVSYSLHCFLFFLSSSATRVSAGSHTALFFLSWALRSLPHTSHSKLPRVAPPHHLSLSRYNARNSDRTLQLNAGLSQENVAAGFPLTSRSPAQTIKLALLIVFSHLGMLLPLRLASSVPSSSWCSLVS